MNNTIFNTKNDHSTIGEYILETENKNLILVKTISIVLIFAFSVSFGFFPYFW